MGRSLLFIGGGELQLPALRWAQSAGLEVVLTDAREDAPGRRLCERFHALDGSDTAALTDLALACQARGSFAGAYCSNDFGLAAVAAIGAATGTPANAPSAVRRALDKDEAGSRWMEADVRTPEQRLVGSPGELRAALEDIGLPAVVKPTGSSGSRGVRSIRSVSEIEGAFRTASRPAPGQPILVQSHATGHHVDVNAFLIDGVLHPGGILDRFFSAPPHCVPVWGCQPSCLDEAQQRDVYALMERAARALGIDAGPVKADVVIGEAGPVILELTPRFHGDVSTAHVTPLCMERSPIQDWFSFLADPAAWSPPAPAHASCHAGWMAVFPQRPGQLLEVRGMERARRRPGIEGTLLLKQPGARVDCIGDNTAVCGFLWATAADRSELERNLRAARADIEVITE